MEPISEDSVQALALLPLDQAEEMQRGWLQNTLAWLMSVPPALRTERLRHLAAEIRRLPEVQERFQSMWRKAFAPRVFSEAGLPEATSLPRELLWRLKRRLLPQLEDELDLYAALHAADLDEADAEWIENLAEHDAVPWQALLGRQADFAVAMRLLATRAAANGLSRAITKVMPYRRETESPFFALEEASGRYARIARLLGCPRGFTCDHSQLPPIGWGLERATGRSGRVFRPRFSP